MYILGTELQIQPAGALFEGAGWVTRSPWEPTLKFRLSTSGVEPELPLIEYH